MRAGTGAVAALGVLACGSSRPEVGSTSWVLAPFALLHTKHASQRLSSDDGPPAASGMM
jgi:hypothetical protein